MTSLTRLHQHVDDKPLNLEMTKIIRDVRRHGSRDDESVDMDNDSGKCKVDYALRFLARKSCGGRAEACQPTSRIMYLRESQRIYFAQHTSSIAKQ